MAEVARLVDAILVVEEEADRGGVVALGLHLLVGEERKANIERALYLTLRDLFSLQVDMVFYDLTSTYFEGQGPPKTGAYGHSRDGKPRNPQVLVGLVLVDGWPIAHHVFEGNWRDCYAEGFPRESRDYIVLV